MKDQREIDFTGEFFVPGKASLRIAEDHMERYKFAANYSKGKAVLDIACGVGYSGPLFIQNEALSYDGVDINEELINNAKLSYKSNKIIYHLGDICTFNNDRKFDLITCFETIEHVEDYKGAIKNLYNNLKPGGKLLISSPNRVVTSPNCISLSDKPKNKYHCQEFIPHELLQILKSFGFKYSNKEGYIFGQRQMHKNKLLRLLHALFYGNPKKTSSAKLSRINKKIPRYFVIVAQK